METNQPSLEQALTLFNERSFFDCHEVLEDLWRPLPPGPEKTFLQGLLQVAVGFYHWQNGNYHGAQSKLTEGLAKLQTVADSDFSRPLNVSDLMTQSQHALNILLTLEPQTLTPPPPHLIPMIQA